MMDRETVGAFANLGNQTSSANPSESASGGKRPALAPAAPEVLERIKVWTREAIKNIGPWSPGVSLDDVSFEIYVRQLSCRKPDCVPLETVVLLLGNGWHERAEILQAAAEVTAEESTLAARQLWEAASKRAKNQEAAASIESDAHTNGGILPRDPSTTTAVVSAPPPPPLPPMASSGTLTTIGAVSVQGNVVSSGGGGQNPREADGGADAMEVVLPRDVGEVDAGAVDVYIVGTNGRKITVIAGLDHLGPTLDELVLRSHVINRMEGLSSLARLTKLELYDNQVEELEELGSMPLLTVLDLSYNMVHTMPLVAECPLLEEIYLAQNKISKIEGLESLSRLRKIDLGGNRIRSLAGVAGASASLEELWLGSNKITRMEHLSNLKGLRRLDLQSNRISKIENLEAQTVLEELYLSNNGILLVEGLEPASATLNTVDLSHNRLTTTEGFQIATKLEEVWIGSNKVANFDALEPLVTLPLLTCVYLEHNPIAKDFEYRRRLKQMIPTLIQIDADPC